MFGVVAKIVQAEFVHLIKRLSNLMNQQIDDVLKDHGMARSQFQVLFHLHGSGALTQKELLERLKVEPATLSGLIDTLENKSYVKRSPARDDKRSKRLELTSQGRAAMTNIPHPGLLVENVLFKGISAAEKEAFRQITQKVVENLEDKLANK